MRTDSSIPRQQADLGPFDTAGEASRVLTRHLHIYKGLNKRAPDRKARMHLHDSEHASEPTMRSAWKRE